MDGSEKEIVLKGNRKEVHFSIDDVIRSFRYIATNRPESIFELQLYGTLKKWHDEFGLKVSMYCISELEGFKINQLPAIYKDEFSANRDWLKFGFHASSDLPFYRETNYIEGYRTFYTKIKEMDAGLTDVIRLHSWKATSQQKKWLVEQGIHTLFYPDEDEYDYSAEGIFVEDGLKHQVTKCWIEKISEINNETAHIGDRFISCFTHEWCFLNHKDKIEKLLKIYVNEGYYFV